MDLSYKQRTLKTVIYFLLVAAAALIQNTPGLTIEIGGARCFLLLPVCMILGTGEDERFAAVLALAGGMLWDLSSGVHLGFNTIYMCIMCFFGSALITYIIRNTFLANFIFSVFFIFLYCLLYWLLFIIIRDVRGAELTLFTFYLPSAVYTTFVTPLIYLSLRPLKNKLNKPIRVLNG
ncbi:MAG TPA: rod shape-determining protein MreD [Candidatus Eubacterium faecavium]|nr:rod shape-determining protein MreD [Candidatus Eubacterium faecavium]